MSWVKLSRDEILGLMSPNTAILALNQPPARRSANDKLRKALNGGAGTHRILDGSFEDDRGRIQDLIDGPIDSITRITTVEGAVRGNHFHKETVQFTFVLSGSLLVSDGYNEGTVAAGEMIMDPPGTPHAWKALEDTDCLVFTLGPRAEENYEDDVFRLDKPLLT